MQLIENNINSFRGAHGTHVPSIVDIDNMHFIHEFI